MTPEVEPNALPGDEAAALYAAYAEFMNDAKRAILTLKVSDEWRRQFLRIHRVAPRQEFESHVNAIRTCPERFARLCRLLERGFQPSPQSSEPHDSGDDLEERRAAA